MTNTNTNTTTENYFEQFIDSEIKIFIDTCSMLNEAFPTFLEHVIPVLEKSHNRIIVPISVNKELIHHLDNPKKPELAEPATKALNLLEKHRRTYFRILGSETDSFPDNLFQELYIKYRQDYRMLFITQDNHLAADILNQSQSTSVHAHAALVKKITPQGYLNNLRVTRKNGKWVVPEYKNVPVGSIFTPQSEGAFRTCDRPTDKADERVVLSEVPDEFDTVWAMNPKTNQFAELGLKELIASGGEGCVYETDTKFVAKIYKEDKVTTRRRDKVMLMAKKELDYGGISFPVIPLFNSHSEFVGYLMKKATGVELGKSVFCPYIKNTHPDWKREDLVKLCITILKKMEYLHSKNILMGDINPSNILVKSPTEVFFVDTDSYQIEDLPCPVGQCNYTAPEIQGKEYNSFLRSMGNENFAIATLLFQILLPGKLPYAHTGGGKQNENILEMNFPYRLGENGNKNEPDGQWKYMWSHLTYAIKEAFYNTFQKDGKYSTEDTRLSSSAWLALFNKYYDLLSSGKLAENDPMSESIFPTRPKAGKDAFWAVCKHCGEKFPYYSSDKEPSYCNTCRSEVVDWIVCADCREEFPLYRPQYDYIQERGHDMPKRCPTCRKTRKATYEEKKVKAETKRFGGLDFSQQSPGQTTPEPAPPKKSSFWSLLASRLNS